MELLRTEFDDKRYPHKYLLKTPSMGGSGLRLRLTQAAENLGLDMPMAHQLVPERESQDGQAYFLFAVALTHEDNYRRLLDEVDRLIVTHVQNVEQSLAEGREHNNADLLLRDYEMQSAPDNVPEHAHVRQLPYEELGKEHEPPTARYDLLADYEAQISMGERQLERDFEWEL